MYTSGCQQKVEEKEKRKLTIFIVDNQPIYRMGIKQVLKEDMHVVGESFLTVSMCGLIETLSPDIVLVDVGLPLLSGFDMARQITTRCPSAAVVMVSPSIDDEQLFQAFKAGAVAFLSRDADADGFISTLREVGQGDYPISKVLLNKPNAIKKVLQLIHNLPPMDNDKGSLFQPLSCRERQVLRCIAEGNPNKGIARALNTSEQTIKNYVASIMRKLNANDRAHSVALAIRRGLLNIGEIPDGPADEELTLAVEVGAARHELARTCSQN